MAKRFLFIILCLIPAVLLPSCSSDPKSGKTINVEIDGKPASLDPQLAANSTELLISRNIFEGLLRIDENGEIQPACAESLEISGLTYTFKLRKDLKWQNGEPLTSADFVFGIRRALLPETRSPNAGKLYSIKNAREIHEGKRAAGELGVSAPDKRTLVIQLAGEDREFEYKLAAAPAMPCNEEFFNNTKGRYGLSADNILCNGAFFVRRWEPAEYVSLRQNTEYTIKKVRPSGAVIYFTRDAEYRALRLSDGRCDLGFGGSSMSEKLIEYDLEPNLIFNTTIMLTLNPTHSLMKYPEIRDAFIASVNYLENIPGYLMEATLPVPPGLYARGYLYRTNSSLNRERAYDPDAARDKFIEITAREKLTKTTIELKYYNTPGINDIARTVAESWQQYLGIVVNISPLESSEISAFISGKDYSAALIPFAASEGSAKSFFEELCRENNTYLVEGSGIQALTAQIGNTDSDEDYLSKTEAAESGLLKINTLTPLIYDGICLGTAINIEGAYFTLSSGYIDLAPVGKTN